MANRLDNSIPSATKFLGSQSIIYYDQDNSGNWSTGDGLVIEGGTNNGVYNPATDQIIINTSTGISIGETGHSILQNSGELLKILFHDANSNGRWDSGEDIVVDVNGNGVYNP